MRVTAQVEGDWIGALSPAIDPVTGGVTDFGIMTLGAADTVLTFDIQGMRDSSPLSQDYGDRVSLQEDGAFSYGGVGITPNVVVDYRNRTNVGTLDWWSVDYSDLTNVVFHDPESANGFRVILTADAGYSVSLLGFDLGNWRPSDMTVRRVSILGDADDQILFQKDAILAPGRGRPHVDFDFPVAPEASRIVIEVDTSGLGGASDDIGLDNIRFSQRKIQ